MRLAGTVVLMFVYTFAISAQDAEKPAVSFEKIRLKAGLLEGNFNTGKLLEHLEGGVVLDFIAKDPAENMTINAEIIDFSYDESTSDNTSDGGSQAPSEMELNGDIVIKAQGMHITSQKAIINLKNMEADFTGYTEILREGDESPMQAERFTVNFDTGAMRMIEAFIPSIDLIEP